MSKGSANALQIRVGKANAKLMSSSSEMLAGGAYRDRTDDLMLAKQPLSQLS